MKKKPQFVESCPFCGETRPSSEFIMSKDNEGNITKEHIKKYCSFSFNFKL